MSRAGRTQRVMAYRRLHGHKQANDANRWTDGSWISRPRPVPVADKLGCG